MGTNWKSFSLFLLYIAIIVSVADALWWQRRPEGLCLIYNKNWTCDTGDLFHQENHPDVVPRRLTPQDDRELCKSDLVGTTLALLEEGDEKIELTENEEAIFLIGNTGTGKSTLTYFLAGNNSALISYYVDPLTNLIKDCNGKIGDSTIVSQTIFPDLVVEELNNTAFYDNPGFLDTRTPCIEIANAYFIKKVVNHVKRAKFVIAVNHASVIPIAARDEFIRTLNNVLSFIPNLQKFLPSVALIGTKVDSAGKDIYIRVEQMSQFLTENKPNLGTVFSEPELTMVNNLFDTLNEATSDGNFTRINVFRMPEECGPLSGIDHMQENRAGIMNIVMNNLEYTDALPSDFGVSLSSDANLTIQEISKDLSQKVVESLEQFSAELLEHLEPQFESQCLPASGCDLLISDLGLLFSNPDFAQDYSDESAWQGLNFTEVISQLVDPIYFPTGFDLSANLSESFEKYGRYLDFLNSLQPLPVDISTWLRPLRSFKSKLVKNIREVAIKWNNGAVDLIQTLATDVQESLKGQLTIQPENFDFQPLIVSLQALFSNPDFQSNYNNNDPSVWKDLTFSQIVERITYSGHLPPHFTISEDVMTGLTNCGKFLSEFQKYVGEPPLDVNLVSWIEPLSSFRGQLLTDLTSLSISTDTKVKAAVGQFSSSVVLHLKGESGFDCLEKEDCAYLTGSLDRVTYSRDFVDDYTDPIFPLLSFTDVVMRLNNTSFLPANYIIPIESSLVMSSGSFFLDYLKGLPTSESLVNVDVGQWLEEMKGFRASLLESLKVFEETVITKMDSSFAEAYGEFFTFFTSKITSEEPTVIVELKQTLVSNYNDLNKISQLETDQGCADFVRKFVDIANKNTERVSESIVSSLNFQAQVTDSLQKYPHVHSVQNREEWIAGFITIVNSIDPALINSVTCDLLSTPVVVHGFFVSLSSSEFLQCFTTAQNNAGSGSDSGPSILVSAFHTVFLDGSIQSPDLNVGIISPNWVIHDTTFTVDLTGSSGQEFPTSAQDGVDGKPGNPGSPGRNFYGVGRKSMPSSGSGSLTILANGGKGGKGENGGGTGGGFNGVDPDMTKVKVELDSNYSPRFLESPYFAQNLVHHIHGMCCLTPSYISGTTCRCANFQIKGGAGQVGTTDKAEHQSQASKL